MTRGALGTTAATHTSGAAVYRWEPPGLVHDLTIAEAITRIGNEVSGYARSRKTGDGGSSERIKAAQDLPDLRTAVYAALGRKARVRSV
ncbi:hypothetical protein DN402_31765 [Streptomyces sp. SW4]|nr:hypothetical protein DN402_31765 [Streptomyces sp. SW4]